MMGKKKPKTPLNPLPCGCGAKGTQDLENAHETGYALIVGWKDVHVVHCPLHKAAPDLLAACKHMTTRLATMPSDLDWKERQEYTEKAFDEMEEAIAKAEGVP